MVIARLGVLPVLCLLASVASGQPPKTEEVRPIPPPGIEIDEATRSRLRTRLEELEEKISQLRSSDQRQTRELLPDVEVFARAVRLALEDGTFYAPGDVKKGEELLATGLQRAEELAVGRPGWVTQTGLVVRGFRSRLDGTVQPYGLVVGKNYAASGKAPVRCDIWFHGRGEKSLELQFIHDRMNRPGEYVLDDGLVLHPFGRYCNAFRFAGEVDVWEALVDAQQHYRLDIDRLSVRGFSMGGAACWGFTVHYPGKWFASNPGAGFSETAQFLGFDRQPELLPPEYQQRMWNLYDAHVLAENLFNVPTIAYSGEIDRQKQASDVMVAAAASHGLELPHIIGPETAHKLHPDSKEEISRRLAALAESGRDRLPRKVVFTTYSLKYSTCNWLSLEGLEEHWREARVEAELTGEAGSTQGVRMKTRNVTALNLEFFEEATPFSAGQQVAIEIDGQNLTGLPAGSGGTVEATFHRQDGEWRTGPLPGDLRKRPRLQGPIDDALMDSFLFVRPTRGRGDAAAERWARAEMERAAREWRRQMRGEVRFKDDTEVTPEDHRQHNLILWGTPESNVVLQQMMNRLPMNRLSLQWDSSEVRLGERTFASQTHVPVFIYPNPTSPARYIVCNSGLTYREFDYLNNARQTPKLPDWAIIDISRPADAYVPGEVVAAGFFDEYWRLPASR